LHESRVIFGIEALNRVVGIMQPYFFPYIGYFQLMAACDVFVFHDDVQYIKAGWVNRNRILVSGAPSWITMPVVYAPHSAAINARSYLLRSREAAALPRRIAAAYRAAPRFALVMPLILELLKSGEGNVSGFNVRSLLELASHLGITRPTFVLASELDMDHSLSGTARVLEICRCVGADQYINLPGGKHLYHQEEFRRHELQLGFLQPGEVNYAQFGDPFVRWLSIIDLLMFNAPEAMEIHLSNYTVDR
jgi:hypothetical protein